MRITYLILAHRYPAQLVRMIRALDAPDTRFLLHWDKRSSDDDLRAVLDGVAGVDIAPVPRHRCHWGGYGIVAGTLEGVAAACRDGDFDRVVLLSGQDYPIKPTDEIRAFFEAQGDVSFVHHLPLPKADWDGGGWDRVQYWHLGPGRVRRIRQAVLNRVAVPRQFPAGLVPHGGAQFWAMTEGLARYVDDFVRRRPDVVRFFRNVRFSDEIMIQTIVANSPFAEGAVVNDTLHFLEWDRPGAVLTSEDLPNIEATYHLFARKFDPTIDEAVLDRLDERLVH